MEREVKTAYSFGEFDIDGVRRLLLKSGRAVNLNPKTFDLLMTLVQNHDRVLSKNELLDRVWENQFVEENNLTVHIAAIRKALGETKSDRQFIVTVPGKGYRFIARLNDFHGHDITMESRRVEHIIIEEETEEPAHVEGKVPTTSPSLSEASDPSVASHTPLPSIRRLLTLRPLLAIAVLTVIALAIIGTGFAIRDRLSAARGSAALFVNHRLRQLTTNGKVGSAALSRDAKLFAYTIDDVGQKSLWIGNTEGGNHLQLRRPAEVIYRSMAFSPDGSQLYFSVRDDRDPKGALYKLPVLGGAEQKVLDQIGNFALSPDGRQLALARSDSDQGKDFIVVASLDGSERRDVAAFDKGRSFVFDSVSWSADGTRLAVSTVRDGTPSSHQAAVVDIATGETTRIEHDSLREITKTRWLADGSGLIVTAVEPPSRSSVPQYRIWHIAYPGGELNQITTDRSNYGASWHNDAGVTLSLSENSELLLAVEHRQLTNVWTAPIEDLAAARQITFSSFGKYDGLWGMDWSPDGTIVYTTSDTRSQFLARMKADGSEQRPLTAPGMIDSVLTVSNDGRYVLFHSDRGGDFDIWRADIDGRNPRQLTFGGQGYHPAPSPDGRWVYYKSFLKGVGELYRVPIDGGDPEPLTGRETSWGSFSPDGKYFAASYITDKQRLAIFSAETNEIVAQFDLPKTATLFMGSRWYPDSKAVMYRDRSYGYWIHPIDGGEPSRLEGLPKEKLYNFAWSKDGKTLAFVRGQEIRDVVLLENTIK